MKKLRVPPQRVKPKSLTNRLDCSFYNPNVMQVDQLLKQYGNLKYLSELVDPTRKITNVVRGPDLQPSNYCLVRLQDCRDWIIDFDGCLTISKEQFKENRRCQLSEGDIVVAIGGYIGNACIARNVELAVIGQHSAVLPRKTDDFFNEGYLVAYLNSKIGTLQFQRHVSGTVQPGINLEDLPDIPIPVPNKIIQTYIGDKVRQAERLRERSRNLEKQLKTLEYKIISADKPDVFKGKTWRTGAKIIDDNRLDPHYYRPDYLESYKQTMNNNFINLGDLCVQIRYGTSVTADYVPNGNGILFIRGLDITRNSLQLAESVDLDNKHLETVGKNKLKAGEVLITRSGTVGIAASVPLQAEGAAFGSFMMAMTLNEEWEPEFIAWFLNSWIGQSQVKKLQNGAIQQNINISELSSIRIWKASQASQQEIKKLILTWQQSQEYAQKLTTAAKLLVEALIEGNVTELDLQEAQEAIQQGDITLDRQILSRLTRKGISCGGEKTNEPPLFPDPDALYHVLSDGNDADDDSDWDSAPKSRQRWTSPIQLSRRAAEASTSYRADDSAVTLLDEEVY